MRPSTETLPKSMLPAAGKPFVHYQLEWLAAEGVTDVVYSIGYRGGAIRDYVGDGSRWGIRAVFVDEGEQTARNSRRPAFRLRSRLSSTQLSRFSTAIPTCAFRSPRCGSVLKTAASPR